jgi:hypothetical protein
MTTTPGQVSGWTSYSAGRDFLIRLVAKHWLAGAARILRALADEFEQLAVAGGRSRNGDNRR